MVLRGERSFNPYTASNLTSLLQECIALKSSLSDAPLNWSKTEGLSTLLIQRRAALAIQENDAAAAAVKV
jgi:hypothetical protein